MKKPTDNDAAIQDSGLWNHVIKSIKPLKNNNISHIDHKESSKKHIKVQKKDHVGFFKSDKAPAFPAAPDTSLDRRSDERLRRGKMEIEATLDLHGLSAAAAQTVLEKFVLEARERHYRCLLVITGKGRRNDQGGISPEPGILKRSLPEWLSSPPLDRIVLRHYPAKGKHGGAGAFYVLLRRNR